MIKKTVMPLFLVTSFAIGLICIVPIGCADDNHTESGAADSEPVSTIEVPDKQTVDADVEPTANETRQLIAYYFHGNVRCTSCRKIEAFAKEAVTEGFPDALKQESLKWRAVNTDEPENRHFVEDYKLYTKSVVLVDIRDSKTLRWKNLEKVWTLMRDKATFIKYVRDEVSEYLEAD